MISRRAVLKGAMGSSVIALGLPLLESMLNSHGTALAAGGALPKRYGLFFWGEGVPPNYRHNATPAAEANQNVGNKTNNEDYWTPAATGTDWPMSELLTPLARHKSNLNVVTGLDVKTEIPLDPPGMNDGHLRGAICALTADRPRSKGYSQGTKVAAVQRPTLDQFIARHPQFYTDHAPSFRSLELGMGEAFLANYGTWIAVSHSGPDLINKAIRDPKQLFDFVFAVPPDTGEVGRRTNVLDAVSNDTRRLMSRLGARDRQRLDEHLTHLNAIERRLRAGQGACTVPQAPKAFPVRPPPEQQDKAGEIYNMDKLDVMGDVLAAALRCDLTRVFTVLFTPPGSLISMNAAGEVNGPGALQMHDGAHANAHNELMALTRYNMIAFAKLLDKLAGDTDVNGQTLLDSSCIFGTSEFGEGYRHSTLEMPVILAGKAGGALDTGWHVRDERSNFCRVHYTILRAMGIDVPSYGFSGAETSQALPFLKV